MGPQKLILTGAFACKMPPLKHAKIIVHLYYIVVAIKNIKT
jgi:hypothetical protein